LSNKTGRDGENVVEGSLSLNTCNALDIDSNYEAQQFKKEPKGKVGLVETTNKVQEPVKTRLDKERKVTMSRLVSNVVAAANSFTCMGKSVSLSYKSMCYAIRDLRSLRNQPSLAQVSSVDSEYPISGTIDTSSSGWLVAINPSKLCFDDIVKPSIITSTKVIDSTPTKEQTSAPAPNTLLQFQVFLSTLFQSANEVDPTDDCFFDKIQLTVSLILAWSPRKTLAKIKTPSPKTYIPSAAAKETKGTRMILSAILFQLHDMLATGIRQQTTTNIKNLPTDAVVNLVAQNLSESLAYVCFAPINAKPDEPVNGTSKTVPGNDVQLVLGHLAEHLAEALGFGGVGVDRKCRGAVLTFTSIEIMELELMNVGASDAKLQLKRSGAYPLFDEKTTRCLLGLNDKDGVARLNPKLVDNDLSKGFAILASLASNKGIESARWR
jgi:hypothetical protein